MPDKDALIKSLRSFDKSSDNPTDRLKDTSKDFENQEDEVKELKPGVGFFSSALPEQEGWEVGEQYSFELIATLTGIHKQDDDTLYEYKIDKAKGSEIKEKDINTFDDAVDKAKTDMEKDRRRMERKANEKEIRVRNAVEPKVG